MRTVTGRNIPCGSDGMTDQETVLYYHRLAERQRAEERAEYERRNYDCLAIYGNILDD